MKKTKSKENTEDKETTTNQIEEKTDKTPETKDSTEKWNQANSKSTKNNWTNSTEIEKDQPTHPKDTETPEMELETKEEFIDSLYKSIQDTKWLIKTSLKPLILLLDKSFYMIPPKFRKVIKKEFQEFASNSDQWLSYAKDFANQKIDEIKANFLSQPEDKAPRKKSNIQEPNKIPKQTETKTTPSDSTKTEKKPNNEEKTKDNNTTKQRQWD